MSELQESESLQRKADEAKVSKMPASKVMRPGSSISIQKGSRIVSAIKILNSHNMTGAPVVDDGGRVVGVITEYDLLLQAATCHYEEPIKHTEKIVGISPDENIKNIIILFFRSKVRWMPVFGKDKVLMGVVRRIDVLNHLIKGD